MNQTRVFLVCFMFAFFFSYSHALTTISSLPYSIQSSNTNYNFTGNFSDNDSFMVNATNVQNVTIDCQGIYLTASSTDTFNTTTFYLFNANNVTIKDCVMVNYTFGVVMNATNFSVIYNNSFINSVYVFIQNQTNVTNGNMKIPVGFWNNSQFNNVSFNTIYNSSSQQGGSGILSDPTPVGNGGDFVSFFLNSSNNNYFLNNSQANLSTGNGGTTMGDCGVGCTPAKGGNGGKFYSFKLINSSNTQIYNTQIFNITTGNGSVGQYGVSQKAGDGGDGGSIFGIYTDSLSSNLTINDTYFDCLLSGFGSMGGISGGDDGNGGDSGEIALAQFYGTGVNVSYMFLNNQTCRTKVNNAGDAIGKAATTGKAKNLTLIFADGVNNLTVTNLVVYGSPFNKHSAGSIPSIVAGLDKVGGSAIGLNFNNTNFVVSNIYVGFMTNGSGQLSNTPAGGNTYFYKFTNSNGSGTNLSAVHMNGTVRYGVYEYSSNVNLSLLNTTSTSAMSSTDFLFELLNSTNIIYDSNLTTQNGGAGDVGIYNTGQTSNIYFLNITNVPPLSIGVGSNATDQQRVDVKVIDTANNPINGANVTIRQKDGTIKSTSLTNASGFITQSNLTDWFKNNTGNFSTFFNPYNVTAFLVSSLANSSNYTITSSQTIILQLSGYGAPTITGCQTLTTSGTLANNVSADGTCFNVQAAGVTLDCAGYTINYSGLVSGYGINDSGFDNLTVKNCFVYQTNPATNINNSYAINLNNVNNPIIFNTTIVTLGGSSSGSPQETNNWGISISNSNFVNVTNNTIITYGSRGNGLKITASNDGTISSNNITTYEYGAYALTLTGSNSTVISSNNLTSFLRLGYGLVLSHSTNDTVSSNNINTSQVSGVLVYGSTIDEANHTITPDNLVEGYPLNYSFNLQNVLYQNANWTNTYGEVLCAYCSNVTYSNITMSNDGFVVDNSSSMNLSHNLIATSKGFGILFYPYSYNGIIDQNNINTTGIYGHAIWLSMYNTASITSNIIKTTGNGSNGIYLETINNTNVTNNTIKTTGDFVGTSDGAVGIVVSGSYSRFDNVSNNTITTSGQNGIGIDLAVALNTEISNNIISTAGYRGYGIFLNSGTNNSNIYGNTIITSGDWGNGYRLSASNSNSISNGSVITSGSIGLGIYFQVSSNNNLIRNMSVKTTSLNSSSNLAAWDLENSDNNHAQDSIFIGYPDNGDIYSYGTGDNYLLNCSFNESDTKFSGGSTGSINVSWYLSVYVNDTSGAPVSNAAISVKNSSGAIVNSGLTNATGWASLNITEYTQNATAAYNQTPHNVTATAGIYASSFVVVMTSNQIVYLTLPIVVNLYTTTNQTIYSPKQSIQFLENVTSGLTQTGWKLNATLFYPNSTQAQAWNNLDLNSSGQVSVTYLTSATAPNGTWTIVSTTWNTSIESATNLTSFVMSANNNYTIYPLTSFQSVQTNDLSAYEITLINQGNNFQTITATSNTSWVTATNPQLNIGGANFSTVTIDATGITPNVYTVLIVYNTSTNNQTTHILIVNITAAPTPNLIVLYPSDVLKSLQKTGTTIQAFIINNTGSATANSVNCSVQSSDNSSVWMTLNTTTLGDIPSLGQGGVEVDWSIPTNSTRGNYQAYLYCQGSNTNVGNASLRTQVIAPYLVHLPDTISSSQSPNQVSSQIVTLQNLGEQSATSVTCISQGDDGGKYADWINITPSGLGDMTISEAKTYTATLTVPNQAFDGNYRLRMVCNSNNYADTSTQFWYLTVTDATIVPIPSGGRSGGGGEQPQPTPTPQVSFNVTPETISLNTQIGLQPTVVLLITAFKDVNLSVTNDKNWIIPTTPFLYLTANETANVTVLFKGFSTSDYRGVITVSTVGGTEEQAIVPVQLNIALVKISETAVSLQLIWIVLTILSILVLIALSRMSNRPQSATFIMVFLVLAFAYLAATA